MHVEGLIFGILVHNEAQYGLSMFMMSLSVCVTSGLELCPVDSSFVPERTELVNSGKQESRYISYSDDLS